MAHPFLDGGPAAVLARSVGESAASFGPRDAGTYRRLIGPLLPRWEALFRDFMALPSTALPRDPLTLARFGLAGLPPASLLLRRFRDERARTLLAGLVGHIMAPLGGVATGAVALVFALAAHARGWPVAQGGSQAISDALAGLLTDHGGTLHTGYEVKRLDDLPPTRAYVFDTSPTALARIAGLGGYYDGYRYGAGCLQARLRARRPRPLDLSGRPPRHHRPPRRERRRDRRGPARRLPRGPAAVPAVPHHRPAERRRRHPRPRGQAGLLGLRPRPQRLERRPHRRDRTPSGGVRPGLPRPRPRPRHRRSARTGRPQRQLRRRGHRLRRRLRPSAPPAPQTHPLPAHHPAPGRLPLLLGHPTGPRRPRHVRPQRCQGRLAPPAAPLNSRA